MNKKLLFICLMVVCLVLGLCGCGEASQGDEPTQKVQMTESYKKACEEFKKVTGVEVIAMEKLEAEEYPYKEGDKSYCFDIIGGDNLKYETFLEFEKYFDKVLSSWTKDGPTEEGDFTNINYRNANGDWIGLTWNNSESKGIYINAMMN